MRKLVVGGVIAALIVAAVLWWRSSESDQTAANSEADNAAAIESRRRARQSGAVNTSPASLAGRVVDATSGNGVAGVVVSATHHTLSSSRTSSDRGGPIYTSTDSAGKWRIDSIAAGRYSLAAAHPDYVPALPEPIDVAPGENRSDIVLRLQGGGYVISGTVSDVGGGPIAGAVVSAANRGRAGILGSIFRASATAVSDDDGVYRLRAASGDYQVSAYHADYVGDSESVALSDADTVVDFTLVPGGVIEGVVLSAADGEPIAAAMVTHSTGPSGGSNPFGGGSAITTDDDGRFVLRGLESGAIYLTAIARSAATSEPTLVELGVAEHVTDVVIYADPAFRVSGFVVAEGNHDKAMPEVLVAVFSFNPGVMSPATTPSASDGYFEVLGVRPGSYQVGAVGDGSIPQIFGNNIRVVDKDLDDVIVELKAGATLMGRVEPPGPAQMSLTMPPGEFGFGNIPAMITTQLVFATADADGNFTMRGVTNGKFNVVAKTDDGSTGTLEIEIVDGADRDGLVVTLEPRATLAGVVITESGKPVRGVSVSAKPVSENAPMMFNFGESDGATTRDDGSFHIKGLKTEVHNVTVSGESGLLRWAGSTASEHEGASPIEIDITSVAGVSGLRLVVESSGETITGRVVGPDGAPVADAWVTATFIPPPGLGRFDQLRKQMKARQKKSGDPDKPRRAGVEVRVEVSSDGAESSSETIDKDEDKDAGKKRRRRWAASEKPVLTDAEGSFEITGLRAGKYDISAEGLKGSARGNVEDIAAGGSVTIKLATLASIVGTVSINGKPVTRYKIYAKGPTRRTAPVFNSEGRYRIVRLEAGTYELEVTAPEGLAHQDKIEVIGGQRTERNFKLVPYGTITGTLVDMFTDEPLEGYAYMSRSEHGNDDGQMAQAVLGGGQKTDEAGRFRVDRVGSGETTIMFFNSEDKGFNPISSDPVELAPGEERDIGKVKGNPRPRVDEDDRGDLGLQVIAATWADRPKQANGEAPTEDDAELYLWVRVVAEGGAAERAGLAAGDRIVSFEGVKVADIGADSIELLMSTDQVRIDQPVRLIIERDGATSTITITPTSSGEQ